MNIIDDFLSNEEFKKIQEFMLSSSFPWYFNDYVLLQSKNINLDDYQFTHSLFRPTYGCVSPHLELFQSCIEKLRVKVMVRVKANLQTRTEKQKITGYHTDVDDDLKCKTAIFYINTNNGYTVFENGSKVQSKSNRMLIFDSNLKHSGVTCTDQKTRVLVNFNYFELLPGQKYII